MPCLVLAIDGGGLRGIIPVLILKHIENGYGYTRPNPSACNHNP